MECRDPSKNSPSGNEGRMCSKCGWVFPNPHPSARHRRAHKKVCGTIQVNDSKTLINGSETVEKMEEIISGFSSGSYRSVRSEEDVFSDAVAEFADSSSGVSDSNEVLHINLDDIDIHRSSVSTMKDVNGKSEHDNKEAEMLISDTMGMNLIREVNGEEYEGRSIVVKLSEPSPSVPEVDNGMDNKVEDETENHTECMNGNGDQLEKTEASSVEELENDGEKVNVDEYDGISTLRNPGGTNEKMVVGESSSSAVTNALSSVEDEVGSDSVDDSVSEKGNDNGAQPEKIEASNVEQESASVEDEVNTHNDTICVYKDSDSVDDSQTEKVKGSAAQMEKNDASNVEELESARSVVKDSTSSVEDEVNTHDSTICVNKDSDSVDDSPSEKVINGAELEKTEASNVDDEVNTQNHAIYVFKNSDSMDDSLTEKVKGNDAQLEKIEVSNVEELESASPVVKDSIFSVEDEVNTNNHTSSLDKTSDSVEDRLTEKVNGTGAQLEKTEALNVEESENNGDIVPGEECFGKVDIGLISDNDDISHLNQDLALRQTDSLECNWGSISDIPAAVENGSPYKAEASYGKSEKAEKGNQHMSLKSYLGESSPNTKETINTLMNNNEWNSPARYPSKIKAEEGKARKPYWAPFICCSSVETT